MQTVGASDQVQGATGPAGWPATTHQSRAPLRSDCRAAAGRPMRRSSPSRPEREPRSRRPRDGERLLCRQLAVWVKPAWVRCDYRSRRHSGTAVIALRLQLWTSCNSGASSTSARTSGPARPLANDPASIPGLGGARVPRNGGRSLMPVGWAARPERRGLPACWRGGGRRGGPGSTRGSGRGVTFRAAAVLSRCDGLASAT
jgi:hypothetical protein